MPVKRSHFGDTIKLGADNNVNVNQVYINIHNGSKPIPKEILCKLTRAESL